MTALETVLVRGLEEHPGDWSIRLLLTGKLVGRGAGDEAAELLSQAPEEPETESQFQKAIELGLDLFPARKREFLEAFTAKHPDSAWGQYEYARSLALGEEWESASQHYLKALDLDIRFRDRELEELLLEATAVPGEDPVFDEMAWSDGSEEPYWPGGGGFAALVPSQPQQRRAARHSKKPEDRGGDEAAKRRKVTVLDRLKSLTVALLCHLAFLLWFASLFAIPARPENPPLVATLLPKAKEKGLLDHAKPPTKKAQEIEEETGASLDVLLPSLRSPVQLPDISGQTTALGPAGSLEGMGLGYSLAPSFFGKDITFFGTEATGERIVFVIDHSLSMKRDGRVQLTKAELSRAVSELPNGTLYQIIFFAGPAWYAGQGVASVKEFNRNGRKVNIVYDGRAQYVWARGWDEFDHQGSNFHYFYTGGSDHLPSRGYLVSSPESRRISLDHIRRTLLINGTDWRWPLRMAMNMEPDTIFFMSDGVFGGVKGGLFVEDVIYELLAYNRQKGNATINTICMKEMRARLMLEQLAYGSGGEFSLVLDEGRWITGEALDKFDTGKDPHGFGDKPSEPGADVFAPK